MTGTAGQTALRDESWRQDALFPKPDGGGVPTAASTSSRRPAPIRLAYCIDNMQAGGTELNALRVALRLDRARHSLVVVTLSDNGPLRARYEAAGIPVFTVPLLNLYGPRTFLALTRLAKFLRRSQVDILHSHDHYSNIFAGAAARLARVPGVITSRRWWESLPRRAHRIGNVIAYRLSDRVLANSTSVAGLVERADRIEPRKLVVVPNFVDEDAFLAPSPSERHQLRRRLGAVDDDRLIGIVANLSPIKDHASLLRAFARVTHRVSRARLAIIGDGPLRRSLEELARSLGIQRFVSFPGFLSNEPNLHHAFDISVLCSRSEGFPNSIVEAMAAARPIVASAVGGVPDAIEHERCGLLVAPGDSDALAVAMERLLVDGELRPRLGLAAQARARTQFHANVIIPRIEELYRSVAGERVRS